MAVIKSNPVEPIGVSRSVWLFSSSTLNCNEGEVAIYIDGQDQHSAQERKRQTARPTPRSARQGMMLVHREPCITISLDRHLASKNLTQE